MKRAIGLPVTTLARRSKSVVFALRSPPAAAGHIHVPEIERRRTQIKERVFQSRERG